MGCRLETVFSEQESLRIGRIFVQVRSSNLDIRGTGRGEHFDIGNR